MIHVQDTRQRPSAAAATRLTPAAVWPRRGVADRVPFGLRKRARAAVLLLLASALPSAAVDYFLGSTASAQGGTVLGSISALNAVDLNPGDRVFFQGGETFAGPLRLTAQDAGTPGNPVVVASYGPGRAVITGAREPAIKIDNAGGIVVRRLELRGPGAGATDASGLEAGAQFADSRKLEYLRFEHLRVTGFYVGVELWGWHSGTQLAWAGFSDVQLSDLEVADNRHEGISIWGSWAAGRGGEAYSHRNVTVSRCVVTNTRGDPGSDRHTGSGIVMSGVDGGVIQSCVVRDNGGAGPSAGGGPFGIWVWEANAITVQQNIVANQRSSSSTDGGAYDLDGGARNCVVQYNYSVNNDGPAIGLIQFEGAARIEGNVVRFNLSENDARRTSNQAALYVGDWGEDAGIGRADIYHNTFVLSETRSGGRPPAVRVESAGRVSGIRIRNNHFHLTHDGRMIAGSVDSPARVLYQGNNYWGGSIDLAAFRADGQEELEGQPTGYRVNPGLPAPGRAGFATTPVDFNLVEAYRLRSDSPLLRAGLDLRARFGIEPGERDVFGSPLPAGAPTIGAVALVAGGTSAPPLSNLSVRARSGAGADVLVAGWIAEAPVNLLIRGVGPGLRPLGVTGVLSDPRLTVYEAPDRVLATNDSWATGAYVRAVNEATAQTGAFPLAATDAAVALEVGGGGRTAHVTGDPPGTALIEMYALSSGANGRLVNLSTRAFAGTGAETLILGFVVNGSGARLLLRGIGPGLRHYNVPGAMPDPTIQLYREQTLIAANDNWATGNRAALEATDRAPLEAADAALLVTVGPGMYTVHLNSADGTRGIALLDLFLQD